MMIGKIAGASFVCAVSFALVAGAAAQDRGTMDLAPGTAIARTMTDEELSKQRGGFMGIIFDASFFATVENVNGNVTGTGTSNTSTTGVTSTSPPMNFNIQGGQIQLSTFVGNLSGLNGVFQLTAVNGVGNVVNSHLTLNVALVNVGAGAAIPSMTSIFGR